MLQLSLILQVICLIVCIAHDPHLPVWAWVYFTFTIGFTLSASLNPWLGVRACRWMGWHREPKEPGFDGCSFHGRCPRCGARILQDFNGNWFASLQQDISHEPK